MNLVLFFKKNLVFLQYVLLKLKEKGNRPEKRSETSLIIRPSLLDNTKTFCGFEKVLKKEYGKELGPWLAKFLTKFHSSSKVGYLNYFVSSSKKEEQAESENEYPQDFQEDTFHRNGDFGGQFIKDSKDCFLPSDRENCAIIRLNGKKIEFDTFHDYFQMLAIFGVSRKDGFFSGKDFFISFCKKFLTKNPELRLETLNIEGYCEDFEGSNFLGFCEIDFQKTICLDTNFWPYKFGYGKTIFPLDPEIILKDFDNFLLATDLTLVLEDTENLIVFIKVLEKMKVAVLLEIAGISNNKKTYFKTNIENKIPLKKLLRYLNTFLDIARKDFVKNKSFFEKGRQNFLTIKRFYFLFKTETNNFAFLKTKKAFSIGLIMIPIFLLFFFIKITFKSFFIFLSIILICYRIKTWKKKRSFSFWKDFYLDFKMNFFSRLKNINIFYLIRKIRAALIFLIFGYNVETSSCIFIFNNSLILTLFQEETQRKNLNIITILTNLAKVYKNAPVYLEENILINYEKTIKSNSTTIFLVA